MKMAPSTPPTGAVISQLQSLNKASFPTETDRLAALEAARALVHRLEHPSERMYDVAWTRPAFLTSFKTAQDLDVFSHLSSSSLSGSSSTSTSASSASSASPISLLELGEKVGAEPALLRRILRVLVTEHVIAEGPVADTYVETDFSRALQDPEGIITGLDVYYLAGIRQHRKLPEYFKSYGYRNPEDGDHPPWKWTEGVPDFEGDRWSWFQTRPELFRKWSAFLSAVRKDSLPWTQLYPPEEILKGWDGESVLLVDVGGGRGRDVTNLARAIEGMHPDARLVLQERAEVIDDLKASEVQLPAQVELVAHNFFDTNPVKGARVYFMHAVIHDWSDSKAHDILVRIREAMKPGYSRLLLFDRVVPERASDWEVKTAALDINMMCNYAALERTEAQWRTLVEGAGLKYVEYKKVPGQSSFMEVELSSS